MWYLLQKTVKELINLAIIKVQKVFDGKIGKWRDDLFGLIERENEASIVIPKQRVTQEKKESQPHALLLLLQHQYLY